MYSFAQRCVIFITILFFPQHEMFAQHSINIIPEPVKILDRSGTLNLKDNINIYCPDAKFYKALDAISTQIKTTSHISIIKTDDEAAANVIISLGKDLSESQYQMDITTDKIRIRAGSDIGVFYATQTLMQLMPVEIFGKEQKLGNNIQVPCVWINDYPRFPYRGMHLDVCRHFFPTSFVKKYIDLLAIHKMNYFHWHLTEDQGWRIEIKKYPKLTEVGSKRKGSLIGSYNDLPHKFDEGEYGGFYTQEEIKEIVKYAQDRFITIVPEIEMPGHAMAALAAYPQYSCRKKPLEVANIWGVFDDVYCANDDTFDFLEDILTEVMALFPGPYIHIGGDECPKVRWKSCPGCQARMKSEGLKNEEELQSYFINRIEKFINAHGKKIIGWDEILEGGLAQNATVMSWRGTQGGIDAAKLGHDVIMTPGAYCYFDHYQSMSLNEPLAIGGFTPLMKVYSYEPIPDELTPEQGKHILGAQANLWTEYIPTEAQAEYMVIPRICALAEVDWSPKESRDSSSFKKRLSVHLQRLKEMGYHYALHIFDPEIISLATKEGNLLVKLIPASQNDTIRYAFDHPPQKSDMVYNSPIEINTSHTLFYQNQGHNTGSLLSIKFEKSLSFGADITMANQGSERYPGEKAANTLVDGLRGGKRFNGINWIGLKGTDLDASLDLHISKTIQSVSVGTIENKGAWIQAPKELSVFISENGKDFKKVASTKAKIDKDNLVTIKFKPLKTRYLKVELSNAGTIKDGDPGAGNPAWLFVDEIMLN